MMTNLGKFQSFTENVIAFRSGVRTPRDLLEEYIAEIEEKESSIGAFAHLDLEAARLSADESTRRYQEKCQLSSIDGLPIGVKDIIDTVDLPTCMNSELFSSRKPLVDATCVKKMKMGGGVLVGKTTTTEFAIGYPAPTFNPHSRKHSPGGSSSGSAAGAASNFFAVALGSQTLGSIIRPSSYCGVIGFKPTYGQLPLRGVHPLAPSLDHLGTLSIHIDDAWLLAAFLNQRAGFDLNNGLALGRIPRLKSVAPTKLGVLRAASFENIDPAAMLAFEDALEKLRDANIELIEPDTHPQLNEFVLRLSKVPHACKNILSFEMCDRYSQYIELDRDKVGDRIKSLVADGEALNLGQYSELLKEKRELTKMFTRLQEVVSGLLLPSTYGSAPVGLEFTGDPELQIYASYLGAPVFNLPTMQVHGMPFGLQLIGFPYSDLCLAQNAKWLISAFDRPVLRLQDRYD